MLSPTEASKTLGIGPEYQCDVPSVVQQRGKMQGSEEKFCNSQRPEAQPTDDAWEPAEHAAFVLGVFLFTKNFRAIQRLVRTKNVSAGFLDCLDTGDRDDRSASQLQHVAIVSSDCLDNNGHRSAYKRCFFRCRCWPARAITTQPSNSHPNGSGGGKHISRAGLSRHLSFLAASSPSC